MEEEDVIIVQDSDGNFVSLPFEAFEALYGELGLSPGVGSPEVNARNCTCAIGVLEAAGLENAHNRGIGVYGSSFDFGAGGVSGQQRIEQRMFDKSARLGTYFRDRLPPGNFLPNVNNHDLPKAK